VEFNKAAQSLSDSHFSPEQKKQAQGRLMKVLARHDCTAAHTADGKCNFAIADHRCSGPDLSAVHMAKHILVLRIWMAMC